MTILHTLVRDLTGQDVRYVPEDEMLARLNSLLQINNEIHITEIQKLGVKSLKDPVATISQKTYETLLALLMPLKPFERNQLTLLPQAKSLVLVVDERFQNKVLFSESLGLFQIQKYYGNSTMLPTFLTQPYYLSTIVSYELIIQNTLLCSHHRNLASQGKEPLFGPFGAPQDKPIPLGPFSATPDFTLRLFLNDYECPCLEINCESREMVYRLLATFQLFESKVMANFELDPSAAV